MNVAQRKKLIVIIKVIDIIVVALSFLLAFIVVSNNITVTSFARLLEMTFRLRHILLFGGFFIVFHFLCIFFGLYYSKRFTSLWQEVLDILKTTTTATLVLFLGAIVIGYKFPSTNFLILFWGVSSSIITLSRIVIRLFLKKARLRGRNLRFMLIAGTNKSAIRFAQKIDSRPELGYRIIGFFDREWEATSSFQQTGYPLVTDFSGFAAFIRNHVIDEVVICLPLKSFYDEVYRIISLCEEQGIIVRLLSSIFSLRIGKIKTEEFEGSSVITVYTSAMNEWQYLLKRFLDFSVALFLVIILAPVFLLTALLIKMSSPGSILFLQERIGINKRRFQMFKFRTMVPDADKFQSDLEDMNEASGPVFKIKNDPRITPFGKFLRRASIDELPQLFNVLKGDMSLVGPRPLPIRDYEGFEKDWHRRRFSVCPGITCLWQIKGRSSISFEEWMRLDMEYIDQWTFCLDLKILLMTLPAVLRRSGAA